MSASEPSRPSDGVTTPSAGPLDSVAPDLLDSDAAGGAALRGGMLRTVGYALGLLISLGTAPVIIRYLGDEEFGRYAAVLAVVAIVAGLTEGGINTVAMRELAVARDRAARDRIMGDLLGLRLALAAVSVVLAIAFAASAGYGGTLVLGTALAGVGTFGALVQSLLASVLQSQLRFGWATAIELMRQVISAVLVVALVLGDGSVVGFLAVSIPAAGAAIAVTVLLVKDTVRLAPTFQPRRWWALLRETSVVAVAVAVNTLYFRITLVLMSLVATAAETTHFAVSFRVMEVLIGLPAILVSSAFPIISRAARSDAERFERAMSRIFELAVMLGTLGAVGLVLGAPFAVEVLTGSADDPATAVLRIQGAGILASFVASATGFGLLGMRRNRAAVLVNVASLIVAVGLTLALAPSMGAQGAAVAAVAGEFLLACTATFALVRAGGPPIRLGGVPLYLGLGGVSVGAGLLVGVHPTLQAAVGVGAYLLLLRTCGRFPAEVAEMVIRRRAP